MQPPAQLEHGETRDPLQILAVEIVEVSAEADEILSIKCVREDGAPLPSWSPGAHVDVILPSGRVRQYSLCGDPGDSRSYRFAVLRQPAGRGGSVELHGLARTGTQLSIRAPRNNFPLMDASHYLFLAGGIGVTPLLPMVREAERRGRSWTFLYGARTQRALAFSVELARHRNGVLDLVAEDERGRPALEAALANVAATTLIYACGPSAMLMAIESEARRLGLTERLHVERFSAPREDGQQQTDTAFDVVLLRSGRKIHVPAGRTLGSMLQECGADVSFSCEEGLCGTCETRVVAGIPDHRDSVLSPSEHAANSTMMVCVGRALSPRLVLDA
jgi:ferredoxin-NADP reductase